MLKHLAMYIHDVTLEVTGVWCRNSHRAGPYGPDDECTELVERVTCRRCLVAAYEHGMAAGNRLIDLDNRPIEGL